MKKKKKVKKIDNIKRVVLYKIHALFTKIVVCKVKKQQYI